jgi:zinc transport system permease protein
MLELLSYPFMLRALAAGIAVALCAGSLGHFLVLRRFAMIGDGLAHVGLGAVALGLLLGVTPIWIAVPLTALASLGILALSERGGLYGEVAIGLVSAVSVAVAVLLASVGRGFSVDLMSYLFGSILAVSPAEVITAWAAALVVVPLLFANLGPLFSLTYDPEFARVVGVPVTWMGRLLVMLTGVTVAVGIRAVGSLLVSSLVIFPAVTALQLRLGFRASLLVSTALAVGSVILGIAVAFALDLPAGATIVMANLLLFILAAGFRAARSGR